MQNPAMAEKQDKLITVRMPDEMYERIRAMAEQQDRSLSNMLRQLLLRALDDADKKKR